MTKKYDLLYIVPSKYTDNEIPKISEKISKIIKDSQAEIIGEEILGRRKIAYPIKQMRYGYFINNTLKAKPAGLEKINKELGMMPEILRFQITKFIPKIETSEIKERQKTKTEVLETKKEEVLELDLTSAEQKTEKPKPEISKKPKVALEDLDKKLDEILKENI